MADKKHVLVIGGAGAQGVPIVRELSKDPTYTIRVLTRDPTSPNAQYLQTLPNVTLHIGTAEHTPTLRAAFKDITHAFVNINSFALGIKNETYWGIQIYQIARQSGVTHFLWSSLDNVLADSNYDEQFRVVHYEGKTRVTEWMKAQPQHPMKWSVITTGPYIQSLGAVMRPRQDKDGVWVYSLPCADGAVPFIHLDDLARYVLWIFQNPSESAGLDLGVATETASFTTVAEAFTAVTGKPARYDALSLDEWFSSGPMASKADAKLGPPSDWATDDTLMTFRESFSGWWRIYRRGDLVKRDYALLDRILPDRIRSVREWMERTGYTGELKEVLRRPNSVNKM